MSKMTPAELDNPLLVDGKAKDRIARDAAKTPEQITRMLLFYHQSHMMQQWLVMKYAKRNSMSDWFIWSMLCEYRKENNEKMPETHDEMMALQNNDIRIKGIAQKM